uniref:Uncharacterized protein n=1 Tax=Scleropages formosus TaxID=113540 RepID=A0A8C9WD99_SCLFO
ESCKGVKLSHHDVGVSVEELDEFLQAPEATLQAAQQELGKPILGSFHIFQQHSDHLDNGEDERSKSHGASVIPVHTNQRHRCLRHIIWLLGGPVVGGKIGTPEEEEDIVKLEGNQVLVVGALPAIEGKQALCIWTRQLRCAGVESLAGEREKLEGEGTHPGRDASPSQGTPSGTGTPDPPESRTWSNPLRPL